MKSTLAIIGSHPKTARKFDFDRTDCDIWMFNESTSGIDDPRAIEEIENIKEKEDALRWGKRRADVIFQMHSEAIWRNPKNRNDANHVLWLKGISGPCGVCDGKGWFRVGKGDHKKEIACKTCNNTGTYTPPPSRLDTPVYMQEQFGEVPLCKKYPLDEIVDRFKVRHFTSSVAYAMALAGYLGTYSKIEIWGVEMETNTEYQYQRDGVTLWIGVLLGLGIEVDAHIGVFDQPLYGYEGEVSIPYGTFDERIKELESHIVFRQRDYEAAVKHTGEVINTFLDVDVSEQIFSALQNQLNLSQKLGLVMGAKSENDRYKKKADVMNAAAGKFLFSRQEFESSAKKLSEKAKESETEVNQLSGRGDVVHKQVQNAAKGSPKRRQVLERYKALLDMYLKAHGAAMMYAGGAKENIRYMERLDKGIRAAGGSKSEEVLLNVGVQ